MYVNDVIEHSLFLIYWRFYFCRQSFVSKENLNKVMKSILSIPTVLIRTTSTATIYLVGKTLLLYISSTEKNVQYYQPLLPTTSSLFFCNINFVERKFNFSTISAFVETLFCRFLLPFLFVWKTTYKIKASIHSYINFVAWTYYAFYQVTHQMRLLRHHILRFHIELLLYKTVFFSSKITQ